MSACFLYFSVCVLGMIYPSIGEKIMAKRPTFYSVTGRFVCNDYYIDSQVFAGLKYLESLNYAVILAENAPIGTMIPRFTGHPTYWGHYGPNDFERDKRQKTYSNFIANPNSNILTGTGITHIFCIDIKLSGLTDVFTNDRVNIYRLSNDSLIFFGKE